jgi:hypothetical protein
MRPVSRITTPTRLRTRRRFGRRMPQAAESAQADFVPFQPRFQPPVWRPAMRTVPPHHPASDPHPTR